MGHITREKALEKMQHPTYDEEMMLRDYAYVVKKFDLTSEEFEAIMHEPPRSYFEYKTAWRSKVQKKWMVPTRPLMMKLKDLITRR